MEDGGDPGPAQSHAVRGDRLEDRLNIRGRARNHSENLGRRRLLLQRLGQVGVAGPELLEESDVLDRDDCLVGESLQQRDLFLRERPPLPPGETDRPDRDTFPEHWYGQHRPITTQHAAKGDGGPRHTLFRDVGDMDDRAFED